MGRASANAAALALAVCAASCGAAGAVDESEVRPALRRPGPSVRLDIEWVTSLSSDDFWDYGPAESVPLALSGEGTRVFASTRSGRLVSLRTSDGVVQWERRFDEPLTLPPVWSDSRLYLGAPDGSVLAVSDSAGSDIWRYATGELVRGEPILVDGVLLTTLSGESLLALDAADGSVLWSFPHSRRTELENRGGGRPTVVDGDAIIGFGDGALFRLDARGDVVWSVDLSNGELRHTDVDEPPVVDGDVLYAASHSGGLYAMALADGRERWHLDETGCTAPLVRESELITVTADGRVLWVDRATGVLRDELQLEVQGANAAVPIGRYLLVTTPDAGMYVLDQESPWIYTRFQPGDGISARPVVSGADIFVMSDRTFVYKLRLVRL